MDAAAGSDTSGDGSSSRPWRTVQRAVGLPALDGRLALLGRRGGQPAPDRHLQVDHRPEHDALAALRRRRHTPNANRWLIWRRDPAYGGRAVIANPDGSDAAKTAVTVSDTAYNNYMIFDGIRFTGESVPKGRAGSNGASMGVYLVGNNNHHFEFRNFEFDGFRQTNAASYESVEGIYQSAATKAYLVNGVFHDIATPGSGGAGGHGAYLHGESGILVPQHPFLQHESRVRVPVLHHERYRITIRVATRSCRTARSPTKRVRTRTAAQRRSSRRAPPTRRSSTRSSATTRTGRRRFTSRCPTRPTRPGPAVTPTTLSSTPTQGAAVTTPRGGRGRTTSSRIRSSSIARTAITTSKRARPQSGTATPPTVPPPTSTAIRADQGQKTPAPSEYVAR